MSTSKTTIFMKKHERIQGNKIIFAVLASILFLGQLWEFFGKLIKNGPLKKMHIEKLIVLLNLLSWDVTNSINIKDNLNFMIFRFIYCVKIFGHIFGRFRYFHIFQFCKKAISQKPQPYSKYKYLQLTQLLEKKNPPNWRFEV